MKVLHIFRAGSKSYGLERNLLCTLPALAAGGVQVIAVAVEETSGGPMSPSFENELTGAGVRIIKLKSEGRLPFALARQINNIVKQEKPDIIHSHDYKCDLAMLVARPAAKRVTTLHGFCSRDSKERFYEWLDVQVCKRLDRVIVFCEDYRQRLLRRGVPDRIIRVVPVGLDSAILPGGGVDFRKKWGVPHDAVVVAQIGRLSIEKRPDVFLQIALDLEKKFTNTWFVLVGDGQMLDSLKKRAASAGAKRVIFAGFVHEMGDVIKNINIAVNTSATEAMPRTVLETASGGVPIVATSVGGVPELIEDCVTGYLCEANDFAAIEANITKLVEDESLRKKMGEAAAKRATSQFNIKTCADKLILAYQELLR